MRRCRPLLGTLVEVTTDSLEAIEAAFAAIARVHRLMSAHEPDSDLSRINRWAHIRPVEIHDETREVLERSLYWWRESGGSFDIAAAGAQALRAGRLPKHADQPAPANADSSVLRVFGHVVRLGAPACLDLGGIAKGYAVDRAIAAMRATGASRGLVNAGGDLAGFGDDPWTIDVIDPRSRKPLVEAAIRDEALATSAIVDGCAAHLPAGGRWSSVTVRASRACDADALTKILWTSDGLSGELLHRARASSFGICPCGTLEPIGERAIAA